MASSLLSSCIVVSLLLSACAGQSGLLASEPKPHDQRGIAFESWLMAERLFYQGVRDRDRDLLVVAARLMERYPARAAELDVATAPGLAADESPTPIASPMAAHHAAEELGRGAFPPVDVLSPGPRRSIRELSPAGRDFAALTREDGLAEVAVVSDDRGDLDLWVRDREGRSLCADVQAGDARCRWRATRGTTYDLVIENVGRATTRYSIILR